MAGAQPVVVEFAGSPKAGKTTTIDIVTHFFKRCGYKVWAPTEGASKRTPYQLKRDLVAFNAWALNYSISEILVAYHNVDQHDLIVLDRGPFDSLAWMGVLKKRGQLSEEEYQIIKNFALHPKWANLISKVFLFTCSPKVSLERENNSKLIARSGTAMNKDILSALIKEYKELRPRLNNYPVHAIDTTPRSSKPLTTSYRITKMILETFLSRRSDPK
jgi:hypothetical protein